MRMNWTEHSYKYKYMYMYVYNTHVMTCAEHLDVVHRQRHWNPVWRALARAYSVKRQIQRLINEKTNELNVCTYIHVHICMYVHICMCVIHVWWLVQNIFCTYCIANGSKTRSDARELELFGDEHNKTAHIWGKIERTIYIHIHKYVYNIYTYTYM